MNNEYDVSEKEYVFWLHYNQPESRKKKKPQMTVHYRDVCHYVDNIMCDTISFGHIKSTQPRWVIKGKTNRFYIDDKRTAYIGNSNTDLSDKKEGQLFSFHYNKSESNRVGKPQISILHRGETITVDNIECNVPVWTETKRMHYTLNGRCKSIKIENNIAHLG